MSSYIPAELRRLVEARAFGRCEYCLIADADTFLPCEVDHIISEKHGGQTVAENLCYSCHDCNCSKGSDIGSIAASTGAFVRFFNPRIDNWHEHFQLDGAAIRPLTEIGEATVKILGFNLNARVATRQILQQCGQYPRRGIE